MEPITVYHPTSRYRLLAGVSLVAFLLLAWLLRSGITWDVILFCGLSLVGFLWSLRQAATQVTLEPTALTVRTPFSAERRVEFNQISSANIEGRGGRLITVLYHPRLPNGLLDLDTIKALILPTLVGQDQLMEQVQARIPR